MAKENKSVKVRVLNVVCSLSLLASVGFIFFAGFNVIALLVLGAALSGVAVPAVAGGDGFFDVLLGIVEAIVEGVVTVFEGICSAVSALFSW